jgi:hypothetical protein
MRPQRFGTQRTLNTRFCGGMAKTAGDVPRAGKPRETQISARPALPQDME